MTSPYKILGISEDAGNDEVKKAYRKLSMRYHPDRNKQDTLATVKFQEINSAYQKLINIGNFEKKMEEKGEFLNNQHNKSSDEYEKPEPIIENIEISLEKAYTGCDEPIQIKRHIIKNKSEIRTLYDETETIYIPIQKGVDNNELIILEGKGNINEYNVCGDIKIFIHVINNSELERRGLDLYFIKTISLKEALCGFSFNLNYLDGRVFKINNDRSSIVYPGSKKIINNLGMMRGENRGNLIINFNIEFPKYIEKANLELLKNLL